MNAFDALEALEPRRFLTSVSVISNPSGQLDGLVSRANARVVKESEPNDDKASADSFVLHTSGNARLKGRFQSNDDRDFFTFTATRSGRMNVNVRGLGGDFAKIEIETAGGDTVFESEPNNSINNGSFQLVNGETYFVRVEKNDPSDHDRYVVKLHLRRRDGGASDDIPTPVTDNIINESEPNGVKAQADAFTLDSDGEAILRGLSTGSVDTDYFVFTPAITGQLRLTVRSFNSKIAELEVENAAGDKLVETDPSDGVNSVLLNVTAGETYFVKLESQTAAATKYQVDIDLQ